MPRRRVVHDCCPEKIRRVRAPGGRYTAVRFPGTSIFRSVNNNRYETTFQIVRFDFGTLRVRVEPYVRCDQHAFDDASSDKRTVCIRRYIRGTTLPGVCSVREGVASATIIRFPTPSPQIISLG